MSLQDDTPLLDDNFLFEGEETATPDTKKPETETAKPEEAKPDTATETAKPEEAKPDTETETAKPDEANAAEVELLKKYNLERYGSLDKALGSVIHKEREIDRLQREARQNETTRMVVEELKKRELAEKADKPAPTIDPTQFLEELQTNPVAAIEKAAQHLGFVRKADIEPLKAGIQDATERAVVTQTVTMLRAYPEFGDIAQQVALGEDPEVGKNPLWDEIRHVVAISPGLNAAVQSGQMGVLDVVPMVYSIAKQRLAAKGPAAPTTTGKERAKTSGGGGNVKPGATIKRLDQMTEDEIARLSNKELEEHLRGVGAFK